MSGDELTQGMVLVPCARPWGRHAGWGAGVRPPLAAGRLGGVAGCPAQRLLHLPGGPACLAAYPPVPGPRPHAPAPPLQTWAAFWTSRESLGGWPLRRQRGATRRRCSRRATWWRPSWASSCRRAARAGAGGKAQHARCRVGAPSHVAASPAGPIERLPSSHAALCLPACFQFDLRNGSLRKKYDALKYTLKKLEVGCQLGTRAAARQHATGTVREHP